MITDWEPLANALRDELKEHGGLLNLFDEQQAAILRRDPDVVLAAIDAISAQARAIDFCRKQRESVVKQCAVAENLPEESPLSQLLTCFAEAVRPLLQALIEEVNHLISRTKKRARQNQMLLARSIEVSQQILQRLNPEAVTKTYSPKGRVHISALTGRTRCLARS